MTALAGVGSKLEAMQERLERNEAGVETMAEQLKSAVESLRTVEAAAVVAAAAQERGDEIHLHAFASATTAFASGCVRVRNTTQKIAPRRCRCVRITGSFLLAQAGLPRTSE